MARPKSPHLPRCKEIFNGGHWDNGFEGFLKGFDGFVNCAKTSLGPGIDFGAARVQVIGQAWYNTIAEDIGFKVTGEELFVHGVKHADWLYSRKGNLIRCLVCCVSLISMLNFCRNGRGCRPAQEAV